MGKTCSQGSLENPRQNGVSEDSEAMGRTYSPDSLENPRQLMESQD